MRTVISDTSPLNYLLLIGEIELLPKLFGEVIIPSDVFAELSDPRAPLVVRAFVASLPEWAKVRSLESEPLDLGLDAGETEAISMAIELHISAILVDERRGRIAAKLQGLTTIGTLNILEAVDIRGLVDLENVIAKLRATSFHVDGTLLDALLVDLRRRRGQ